MSAPARPGTHLGGSPVEPRAAFEAHLRARLSRAREHVPPAHLDEFDAVLAHVREGHHGWTMLWSPTQRRLMSSLGDAGGQALRISTRQVGPSAETGRESARSSTVRALVKLGLLDWAEPTSGTEWIITASVKGRSPLAAVRMRV